MGRLYDAWQADKKRPKREETSAGSSDSTVKASKTPLEQWKKIKNKELKREGEASLAEQKKSYTAEKKRTQAFYEANRALKHTDSGGFRTVVNPYTVKTPEPAPAATPEDAKAKAPDVVQKLFSKPKPEHEIRYDRAQGYLRRLGDAAGLSYLNDKDAGAYIEKSIRTDDNPFIGMLNTPTIDPQTGDVVYGENGKGGWLDAYNVRQNLESDEAKQARDEYAARVALGKPTGRSDYEKEVLNNLSVDQQKEYSYRLGKFGMEAADDYLSMISEGVTNRAAQGIVDSTREDILADNGKPSAVRDAVNAVGRTAKTGGLAFQSGLDQFRTGVGDRFTNNILGRKQTTPASAVARASADVRDDMGALPGLAYDVVQNSGMMAPTFAATALAALAMPAVAAPAAVGGATSFGASLLAKLAADAPQIAGIGATMLPMTLGSSYEEGISKGLDPNAARAYAMFEGINQAGLEYALGGFEELSGGYAKQAVNSVLGDVVSDATKGEAAKTVARALQHFLTTPEGRIAFGMGSEAFEEIVQGSISNALGNAFFGEHNAPITQEDLYSALVASLSAGVSNTAYVARGIANGAGRSFSPDAIRSAADTIQPDTITDTAQAEEMQSYRDNMLAQADYVEQGGKLTPLERSDLADAGVMDTETETQVTKARQKLSASLADTFGEEGKKAFAEIPAERSAEAYREFAAYYNSERFGTQAPAEAQTLTPEQVTAAMKAGALDANAAYPADVMKATARSAQRIQVDGVNAGAADRSGINYDALTPQQKLRVDFTDAYITKGLGMDVRYIQSDAVNGNYEGINGSFSVVNGRPTITLDVNAGMNKESDWTGDVTDMQTMLPVISHEITHFLEKSAPEAYKAISDAVIKSLANNRGYTGGYTINQIVRTEMNRMDRTEKGADGKPIKHTEADALHEIVARACEDMLSGDAKAVQAFETLDTQTKATLWDHIKSVFDNIREFFQQMLSSYKSDSAEAKAIRQNMDEFEKIRSMWQEALNGDTTTVSASEAIETAAQNSTRGAGEGPTFYSKLQREIERFKGNKNADNENPTENEDIRYSSRLPIVRDKKVSKAQEKRDRGEMLTERQFYQIYSAHKLNLRGQDNLNEQIENIKAEGFKGDGGFGNNVVPASINPRGYTEEEMLKDGYTQENINWKKKNQSKLWVDGRYYPSVNLTQKQYGARKGDTVMFVSEADLDVTKDTEKVKRGYRPFDYEIVTVERDYQPYYELYKKAYEQSRNNADVQYSTRINPSEYGQAFYSKLQREVENFKGNKIDQATMDTIHALDDRQSDLAATDDVMPETEITDERTQYSLRMVDEVKPSSDAWKSGFTTDQAMEVFPDLWNVAAEESETKNPTSVKVTLSSYRKIYDQLKAEGFNGTIMDASSGLGYGTEAGINDYGFDVEDIEPYPGERHEPTSRDYSSWDKTYDVVISNAVLNVLPQEQRDAMVAKIGEMLNPGGRAFVNVRSVNDVKAAKSKLALDADNGEYVITSTGSYQKGFSEKELTAYLRDALGDGYTVTPATKKFGSGSNVWAEIRKNESSSIKYSARDIREIDEEYAEALESGNEDWQLQLVGEAAYNAGYTVGAYHGSPFEDIHRFNTRSQDTKKQAKQLLFGTHFTQNLEYAKIYSRKAKNSKGTSRMASKEKKVYNVHLDLGKSLDLRTPQNITPGMEEYKLYEDVPAKYKKKYPPHTFSKYDTEQGLGSGQFITKSTLENVLQAMSPKEATDFLVEHGYNSVLYDADYSTATTGNNRATRDPSIIMLDPERIKSGDPVTYDDNGNIIPLAERFNPASDDIRFSRRDADHDAVLADLVEKYGALPKGENTQVDVSLPAQTSPGKKTRRYARTVLESGLMSEQMSDEIKEKVIKEALSYEPMTDKDSAEYAASVLRAGGTAKAQKEWDRAKRSDSLNKDDLAVAQFLLKEYANNGDVDNVIKMVEEISAEATRMGQNIQSLRLLKKYAMQAPEVGLGYIQRTVDQMNRDNKRKMGAKYKEMKIDTALAAEYLNAKTSDEIDAALGKIYKDLGSQVQMTGPEAVKDKLRTWRYLSMLGNPRTHVRNLVGNAIFVPAVRLKNVIGAEIEKSMGAERTKGLSATPEARAFAMKDALLMRDALSGKADMSIRDLIMEQHKVYKIEALNKLSKANSDALETEDWWFLRMHYQDALAKYITANNMDVNNMDGQKLAKARNYALKEAQKATYRDANKVSAWLNQSSKAGKVVEYMMEGMLPFKKTPTNILRRGVEYSPAGLIGTLTKGTHDLNTGKITLNEYIDGIASGLSGTAIFGIGMFLASTGLILGGYADDDDKERRKLRGDQEYAVKIGNHTYTVDWAAPGSLPLFIGVETMYGLKRDHGMTFSDITAAATRLVDPMINMSMLSGLNDTLDAISYSEDKLSAFASETFYSLLGQYVPTISGQIARTIDTTQRINYQDKNTGLSKDMLYFIEKMQNKIPMMTFSNDPYLNEFGQENVTESRFVAALQNFISPGYISKVKDDRVLDELDRLSESQDENVLPKKMPKFLDKGENRVDLTSEQYTTFQRTAGQLSYNIINNMIDDKRYRQLTAEEQAEAISIAYSYAKAAGRIEIQPEYKDKLNGNNKKVYNAVQDGSQAYDVILQIVTSK